MNNQRLSYYCIFSTILIVAILPGLLNAQSVVKKGEKPQSVVSGFQFTEGPYWHPDGYLLFSDIPANTIYTWTPGSSEATEYLKPSGHSNGITADNDGNLILAQHDGKISKVTDDKKIVVLAESYENKRLNSPNDVTVSSKGTIYFTDPPFGVDEKDRELSFSGVFMLRDGKLSLMYDGFDRPNGVVLSPDEKYVYVNNTSSGEIMRFEVAKDGTLQNGKKFAEVGKASENGAADGMVVDASGRLYSTGPGGIYVFSAGGEKVELIEMPARATNLEWGGKNHNTLYITTPSAVYRLQTNAKGVRK